MAKFDTTETQKIAATSTDKFATFDGGIQSCYLIADGDCFVDFDRVAQVNSSLLLKANVLTNQLDFGNGNIQQVHAITSGASVNVYVLGIRK